MTATSAPRLNCLARIASPGRTTAPRDAATSRVASSLAPSATMTSAAPEANAESIAEAIRCASFRAAMMTVTGAVKRWMVTSARVNCYILTGGRSERMGQSKTELFLARVVAAATPLFDDVVLDVAAPARRVLVDEPVGERLR